MEDPIIHFYETFLSEYDPKLRKARGVWYTPAPVVNFIVRAVDDILKTEFDLPQGLADTSKISPPTPKGGAAKKTPPSGAGGLHKVQILDPATGTGTFLAETIKHIHKKFEGQQGIWSNYVETHLLPRLNGFELLMASYAMAHLQLDLLLTETGFKPTTNQRLRVYLTNSLEESHPDTGTLFANWLSSEANEANHIKRDAPVMCVIGNPPYAVSSTNKNEWIQNLISDYKKDLNERKINLDDDYIKFIRYGQHYIDKNGSGVLAYISNNSFIDGITHRQMRKNLLESFDKIYILDLHGNAKKKEVCPDGSADQNVFDIMQGVSINIFIKTGQKKKTELGQVYHFDLQGKREFKYETLNANTIQSFDWKKLEFTKPNYFFVPKNFDEIKTYEKGFKINDLFISYGGSIKTERDKVTININKRELITVVENFKNLSVNELRNLYGLFEDSRDWGVERAKNDVITNYDFEKYLKQIEYRPFDKRFIYYTGNSKGFIGTPGYKINRHLEKANYSLNTTKYNRQLSFGYFFISNCYTDIHLLDSAADSLGIFPLYLYPDEKNKDLFANGQERTPNLNPEIVNQIATGLGLSFSPLTPEGGITRNATTPPLGAGGLLPIDLLDYIYAVLHSPTYREKYKEFLKIDFPRVPFPHLVGTGRDLSVQQIQEKFWQLVKLGGQIRQIHLLESPIVEKYITQYPNDGDNVVGKILFEKTSETLGRVYINYDKNISSDALQYFNNVPEVAWDFYIGGYQPAQKWLKDRKDRKLEFDDILHYQKIIVALSETDRLMKEIDTIEID